MKFSVTEVELCRDVLCLVDRACLHVFCGSAFKAKNMCLHTGSSDEAASPAEAIRGRKMAED